MSQAVSDNFFNLADAVENLVTADSAIRKRYVQRNRVRGGSRTRLDRWRLG
jgi:hypothetical protein